MRFHVLRTLRFVIFVVSSVWLMYLIHAFVVMDDLQSASQRSKHAAVYRRAAEIGKLPEDDAADLERRIGSAGGREQHGLGIHGRHDGNVPRMYRAARNSADNPDVINFAVNDRKGELNGLEEVGNDVDGDVKDDDLLSDGDVKVDLNNEEDSDDPFHGVTYPPYVEILPDGAIGQGPKGLLTIKGKLTKEELAEYEEKWNKNSFNQYSSDRIPVHRHLPDYRATECKEMQYPADLPSISVVIIFHNEAWSVLLRSVHSILDRTKPDTLIEVILVDDFSSMDHLKLPLDKYFHKHPKVKIVRAPERGGLTKARLIGFGHTTGDVVVFLDSHIECTEGWAEPLQWMIQQDYRRVPFPLIDIITSGELGYIAHDISLFGIFSLSTMTFRWSSHLIRKNRPITQPKPSPTMPGGLFAISRKWFIELGKYDPQLDYWGGENLELSFKAWMCGGSVVIAQCSHIGHIFRSKNPIKWSHSLGNRNYVRVAMVWMDEYKNHYLERSNYRVGEYGDISDRLAVRDRLKCKGFGWYVDNVYPELKEQVAFNAYYAGEFRNVQSNLCLDKMDDQHPGPQLYTCHQQGANQFWYFRDNKYIQADNKYVCQSSKETVKLCPASSKQEWQYYPITKQLVNTKSMLCLQKSVSKNNPNKLIVAPCKNDSLFQKWTLERRRQFKYR